LAGTRAAANDTNANDDAPIDALPWRKEGSFFYHWWNAALACVCLLYIILSW
jgi:hypothetical protein